MASIFLSYRRDDRPGFAGRLSETLEAAFGEQTVFRDVDDIRPGQDFVAAIGQQLRAVGVILVMIGPAWLVAEAGGRRRLDDPEDFVRMEVLAALDSGKPVIPVLVSGAAMPGEKDLPEPLRPLARRQAFTLSDAGWKDDVARLVSDIRPLIAGRRANLIPGGRLGLGLAGAGITAALTLAVVAPWRTAVPPPAYTAPVPPDPAASSAPVVAAQDLPAAAAALHPPRIRDVPATAGDVAGRWRARVKYDWGAARDESFEFKVGADELYGTATHLGLERPLEQVSLEGRRLVFVTHTQEVLGEEPAREVTHRYVGVVEPEDIRFTLITSGGYSQHEPVDFVARRTGKQQP
jgi:TIR domain